MCSPKVLLLLFLLLRFRHSLLAWRAKKKNVCIGSKRHVEACVAEWLTPRTPDLEVRGSSLARHVVSLEKELYSTLSLFTQV